ncbi:MAG: acyltransferase [Terriglobales bacterium]|jgi:peptidoglycan/LPS O-acetylase OafA/YrhL
MPLRRYIPELDGLRAFAIGAVLFVHCNFGFQSHALEKMRSYGWVGVDLFFAISGYLITSILVSSRDQPHYYRNFYARRGLRIWPLYYLLLLFVFVLSPHLGLWARQDFDPRYIHWEYYVFYVQNLVYARLGSFALVITWSLCVEEQFYLVWPFAVRLCSRRTLTGVALAVLLLGTPFRMFLHHIDSSMGFFFTFTRLDPIAAGALAVLQPKWFRYTWLAAPWAAWLLIHGDFEYVYFALALTFASVVLYAAHHENRVLRAAPLRFVGKVSYGVYIFHPIAFAIFWRTPLYSVFQGWPHANLPRMIGQMLFPIPFAVFSWYVYEQPILRLKRFFEAAGTANHETSPAAREFAEEKEVSGHDFSRAAQALTTEGL